MRKLLYSLMVLALWASAATAQSISYKSATFYNGIFGPGGPPGRGSVLIQRAENLAFLPPTTRQIYFSVNLKPAIPLAPVKYNRMSAAVPYIPLFQSNDMTSSNLMSVTGGHSFAVNILPSNPNLNSTNQNGVLALELTNGITRTQVVRAMWPDFVRFSGWHNYQIAVTELQTIPARWNIIGCVDAICLPPLFFDDNWNQLTGFESIFPKSFDIPLLKSGGVAADGRVDYYLYSVGQEITSYVGGLKSFVGPAWRHSYAGQIAGLSFWPNANEQLTAVNSLISNGFVNPTTTPTDLLQRNLSIAIASLNETNGRLSAAIASNSTLTASIQQKVSASLQISLDKARDAQTLAQQLGSLAQQIQDATQASVQSSLAAAGIINGQLTIPAINDAYNNSLTAQIQAATALRVAQSIYGIGNITVPPTTWTGQVNLPAGGAPTWVFGVPTNQPPPIYLYGVGSFIWSPISNEWGTANGSDSFGANQWNGGSGNTIGDGSGGTGPMPGSGSTSFYTPTLGFTIVGPGSSDPYQ